MVPGCAGDCRGKGKGPGIRAQVRSDAEDRIEVERFWV